MWFTFKANSCNCGLFSSYICIKCSFYSTENVGSPQQLYRNYYCPLLCCLHEINPRKWSQVDVSNFSNISALQMQFNNYGHQPTLQLELPYGHILQLKWTKISLPVLCSSITACFYLNKHVSKYWNQIVLHILWRSDTPCGNGCFQDWGKRVLDFTLPQTLWALH